MISVLFSILLIFSSWMPKPPHVHWPWEHGKDVVVEATHPHRVDCNVVLSKPAKVNGRSAMWRAVRPSEFSFPWCKSHYAFNALKAGAPAGRGEVVYATLRTDKSGIRGRYTATGPGAKALGDDRQWRSVRLQAS